MVLFFRGVGVEIIPLLNFIDLVFLEGNVSFAMSGSSETLRGMEVRTLSAAVICCAYLFWICC